MEAGISGCNTCFLLLSFLFNVLIFHVCPSLVDHICVVYLEARDRTQCWLLGTGFAEEMGLPAPSLLLATLSRTSLPVRADSAVWLAPLSLVQEVASGQLSLHSRQLSERQWGVILEGSSKQACHNLVAEVMSWHDGACCLSVEDMGIYEGNLSDVVVESDVPLYGTVCEAVVGTQLVSSVHSSHVGVVVLHTLGLD